MTDGWVLARTQANREKWAAENIMRQGAEYYLPRFVKPVKRDGRVVEIRAEFLFPNYIFVRAPGGRWRWLTGTFGVSKVVQFGEQPAKLADSEIERLRALEDDEGLIRLPEMNKSRFNRNQQVRVVKGHLEGQIGIFQETSSSKRVCFLLSALGRKVPVILPEDYLEVA